LACSAFLSVLTLYYVLRAGFKTDKNNNMVATLLF
jgi:hypothetical protein